MTESADSHPPPCSAWGRLHAALMPDYNRRATVYWWTVVVAGAATIAWSFAEVLRLPPSAWLQVAIGTAIAMLAGVFPVRVPHSKNSFAAGETFMFLVLLIHGPAAATITAAAEAAIGSYRTSKRWTSRIVSPAMAAIAMYGTGSVLSGALQALQRHGLENAGFVIVAAMLFALGYFVCNTLLVTAVPRLKNNQHLQWSDLFGLFGWVGVAYAGSAAVAALLFLTYQVTGPGVLMAMVPVLAMLLATLHYFFRQQEAAEAVRRSSEEAQAREAELAARHVRELEASERRFHSAFTHASIGMALLDVDGRILQVNDALRELLARDDEDLLHQGFEQLVWPEDLPTLREQFHLVHEGATEGFETELRCRHRSGEAIWVAVHCAFFSEPGATTPSLIVQMQDMTARRRAEAGLHHLAFHDSLTGLPNRRRFHEYLTHAIARAKADPGDGFAVMFLDFDRFKLINDSLGHEAGDQFLVQVAQRIREGLRDVDRVARLGGDEFAVLVQHLNHEQQAVTLAERLMELLKRPFHVGGTELNTSASIGITFSAFGYNNGDEVLRDADTAMYKAKSAGKARYALFDTSLHIEVAQRLRLEGELRRAVEDGLLSIAYQPLMDLADNRPTGFEALVRWNHPQDGHISPAAFLPIAEEAGLMLRLSDFVLHCACHQLHRWQQIDPAYSELRINVNVSGQDIAHSAFTARVSRAIVEAGLQPRHLTLELTENILMTRLEGAMPMLTDLRNMGVGLAVDDFGTGYSSLAHLSTLPIDSLKIDRSFVNQLRPGSKEAAVVRSIILLGDSLDKTVVAEGIETAVQLGQLREMGCAYGQGFLLARPMSELEVEQMLRWRLNERPRAERARAKAVPTQPAPLLH